MRVWPVIVVVTTLGAATGCYVTQPIRSTPQAGLSVATFDLNDVGRSALGPLMGPGIDRISGTLLQQHDTSYVVSVHRIRRLNGDHQRWSGETVQIRREYVQAASERRLSKGRTIALGVAAAVGLAAVVFGTDLLGSGIFDSPPDTTTKVPPGSLRLP